MKILRRRAVEAKTGLGHTEIYEQIGLGLFPKPVRPSQSGKVVGWIEAEIDQWIADLIAKRDRLPTHLQPQKPAATVKPTKAELTRPVLPVRRLRGRRGT